MSVALFAESLHTVLADLLRADNAGHQSASWRASRTS